LIYYNENQTFEKQQLKSRTAKSQGLAAHYFFPEAMACRGRRVHAISGRRLQAPQSVSYSQTHEVFNQSRPFLRVNLLESDPALKRSIVAFLKKDKPETLQQSMSLLNTVGERCGSEKMMQTADLAEKNRPTLRQFDHYGNRIDVVDFHPAYHELMSFSLSFGGAAHGYNNSLQNSGSHVTRAALMYMMNQLEPGHCCPVVMTSAAVPVLRKLEACKEWTQKLLNQNYDPRNVPISEKNAITVGMSMTEKQGGSDVRANTTTANAIGKKGLGEGYELRGHKWFTSAPMSDGFLTLARTPGSEAPSCFLVPRWKPDGSRNIGFRVMRLKDKLADRANASSEVEYDGAYGMMISEEGRGVKSIIEMVQCTRLDCTLGGAGGARRALMLALNHTNTRSAFGKKLSAQPLMKNVLTDLCIEAEAHTLTALRMAAAFDRYERDDSSETERNLFRVGVSVSKYYVTKRQANFAYECMETFGGNGFTEDFQMAKLFRHSPLNSIWEGSGNVIALDVLRAAKALPALLDEIKAAKGLDSTLDSFTTNLEKNIVNTIKDPLSENSQFQARKLVDSLALGLQASLMTRYGHPKAAKCFLQSRIGSAAAQSLGNPLLLGSNVGSFPYASSDCDDIIADNMPIIH